MDEELITIEDIFNKQLASQQIAIWQQFIKWCHFQFESERHVLFGRIGNYGYKVQQKTNKKIPYLFLDEPYLRTKKLIPKIKINIFKPLVKINYQAIAKHFQDDSLTKEYVETTLIYLIQSIQNVICRNIAQSIKIDLGVMGKIIRVRDDIWFQYYLQIQQNSKRDKKITLRNVIQTQERKIILSSRMSFYKDTKLPKIQIKKKQQIENNKNRQKSQTDHKDKQFFKCTSLQKIKIRSRTNSRDTLKTLETAHEWYNKVDNEKLGWEMMGAGRDPLKKKQDYAKLTSNTQALMKTQFKYPQKEPQRSIPLLDIFSRTLCCPISSQRQNQLVCARIGSNLSLRIKKFIIGNLGIEYKANEFGNLTNRKKIQDIKIINEQQQYNIVIKQHKTIQEQNLIKIRKESYQRYRKLFEMIDDRHILEFSNELLGKILGQINQKFENQEVIEQMSDQISHQYNQAIKKAVIEYILLDPNQQDRLSVYIKFKTLPFYGQIHSNSHYQPKKSRQSTKRYLDHMILKNTRYSIKIQSQWLQKYSNHNLLNLPYNSIEYISVDQFSDMQKVLIKKTKDNFINEWIPYLSQIYKLQTTDLNRNFQYCNAFFESTATMLHIQIRNMIYKALQDFNRFFSQYDMEVLNPPDTAVYRERTQGVYQKCFLTIRISHKKDQIYFMDNLDDIESKILIIVDKLRQLSVDLPRPQNLITKASKLYLWSIPVEDEYYQKIRHNISRIVVKNVQNCKKSIEVFNKYKYILNEVQIIDNWVIKGEHDRRQYSIIIKKYQTLYQQILEQVPFFIRLNLIHVDSSELKRYLLKIIQQVNQKIQKSIFKLIMKKNQFIQRELDGMVEKASSVPNTCQKLIQIQNELIYYRKNKIKNLSTISNDMIKWITITLYNSLYPVSENDIAFIYQTHNFLHNINPLLDQYEASISKYRKILQNQVRQQSKLVKVQISNVRIQLQKFKQYNSRLLKDNAIQLVQKVRNNVNLLKKKLRKLNIQQNLLSINQTQNNQLMTLEEYLKIFQDLWYLVKDYTNNNQMWSRQSIFTQDGNLILAKTQQMYKAASQITKNINLFNFAPKSNKVAAQLGDDIRKFQNNIPIISVFSSPHLKPKHFQQINKLIGNQGQQITRFSSLNLNKVLGLGFGKHIILLEKILQVASKQSIKENQ